MQPTSQDQSPDVRAARRGRVTSVVAGVCPQFAEGGIRVYTIAVFMDSSEMPCAICRLRQSPEHATTTTAQEAPDCVFNASPLANKKIGEDGNDEEGVSADVVESV